MHLNSAEEYRQWAVECVRRAGQVHDHECRAVLVGIATLWLSLADIAEKNSRADLTYETPPRPTTR